jgi:predicted metal-dependent hydrolase
MGIRALTSDNIIQIADIPVLVKPNVRARGLTLRYNLKKACFVASVPKRISRKAIIEFLTLHADWMQQQLNKIPVTPSILEQGFVTIEGIDRTIIHQEAAGVKIILDDDSLIVMCRAERLPRAIQRFLIQHAEKVILELAYPKAQLIDKKITKVTLRDTTSRWGSCASDGSLSFSWRLIMAPMATIDYVVAHEVAHLKHFDHSQNFWAVCRELSASFTSGKHWLKLNGAQLHLTTI